MRSPPTSIAMPVSRASLTLAAVLLASACGGARATELLPKNPMDGLQVTMTLACDFDDDFWDATLLYGATGPLNLSYRDGFRRERRRNLIVTPEERLQIYAGVRDLLAGFQLGEWDESARAAKRGELTFTVSVLLIKPGIGRVDSVDLAIDLTQGRPIPVTVQRLLDTLGEIDRRMRMNLRCP